MEVVHIAGLAEVRIVEQVVRTDGLVVDREERTGHLVGSRGEQQLQRQEQRRSENHRLIFVVLIYFHIKETHQ